MNPGVLYLETGRIDRVADEYRAVDNLQQGLSTGFPNAEAIRAELAFDPIRNNGNLSAS